MKPGKFMRRLLRERSAFNLTELRKQSNFLRRKCCHLTIGQVSSVLMKLTDIVLQYYHLQIHLLWRLPLSPHSCMVIVEKCGNCPADLHNVRDFESILVFALWPLVTLVTCLPVLFEVKTTHFYYDDCPSFRSRTMSDFFSNVKEITI